MLTGSRMATAERILRIMGSSFPRWRRQGTALRRCCGRASRGRRSIRRSRAQLGACCQEFDATDAASQRFSASSSGDLASSRPVGSPRQVPAGDGPYALTSSAPCPHRRSALRADRLLVLGVSSAAVDAPAPQPRIIPLSGSMTLGGTSTVTTALLSPEVASASPTVKAPHK